VHEPLVAGYRITTGSGRVGPCIVEV
jgi:hypothetical protein